VTTVTEAPAAGVRLELEWREHRGALGWLTTVDHKRLGILFFFTSLAFFAAGGVEALLLRTQLVTANAGVLGPKRFDELMTMHGTTMIFLFVVPMGLGAFGNYLVPLLVGARDLAFPRLNALSYWIFLASGVFVYAGLAIGQAPDQGWFSYVPLAEREYSPSYGVDFYALGLIFAGMSTTATAINLVTTIFKLRAPGMSLNRMPLFCYAQLAAAGSALVLLPPLTLDLVLLELQRKAGFHFFDVAGGGSPLLWQHLFWLFGHPEVYLIVLPAFGITTSIIPTFARRKMIAAPLVALAELLVAFIGFGVWAHHMFTTGLPNTAIAFFAAATLMVVIPSTVQIYAWLFTVNLGRPQFKVPLLFVGAFIVFFVIGGLSGIMFAAVPFDQATTDTYFVVAHFHFVIFGAAVFPILGGIFYWFPKVTGRMYHEGWAQAAFWLTFWGTALTFFPMHIVGLLGMPRRVYTYQPGLGWDAYNLAETIGAFILAGGLLLMTANLVWSRLRGPVAGPNPFGGATLEWATSSPPPPYNFAVIPRVGSEYPLWEPVAGGVAPEGHETLETSVRDAEPEAVVEMPAESAWPPVVALLLAVMFALALTTHFVSAGVFAGLAGLAALAWLWKEPELGASGRSAVAVRGSQPRGWWGAALFVLTEATLFGTIFGSWFFLRYKAREWPPAGEPRPAVWLPLILAGALATTSLLMARRSRGALALAVPIQAGYLGVSLALYVHDLHRDPPQASAYASIRHVLVGAGHFHVLVGIAVSLFLLAKLLDGRMTPYRAAGLRGAALYWHFVNVLALVIVGVQATAR